MVYYGLCVIRMFPKRFWLRCVSEGYWNHREGKVLSIRHHPLDLFFGYSVVDDDFGGDLSVAFHRRLFFFVIIPAVSRERSAMQ